MREIKFRAMTKFIFVDPYELTMEDGENIVYDVTNWLQEYHNGNNVVPLLCLNLEVRPNL